MKVLFIIDTLDIGGAETSISKIISQFEKVDPVVIHLHGKGYYEPFLKKSGVRVYGINLKNKNQVGYAVRRIGQIVNAEKPEIIHSTLYLSNTITWHLKQEYKFLWMSSFVSKSYGEKRYRELSLWRALKLRLIQWKDQRKLKDVDHFISNSENIKKANCRALKLDERKITVIPRGRDRRKFNIKSEEAEKFKKDLNFVGKDILLTVGRLIKSKGHDELIRAFKEVAPANPTLILVIVGEGEYRAELEAEIANSNLQERILLMGSRTDVPIFLSIAKIFVFPSHLEGMPGSLIEAMMSGVPIISSDIPENKECIPEGGGEFFETGNISQMAGKIKNVLKNYSVGKEKAEIAYQYAIENYDIKKIAKKYEDTYTVLKEGQNS